MAIAEVREYFRQFGMEDRVLELEESSATVDLAARALGCAPGKIAKTLSFLVQDRPILILTAGDEKIDNKKYKARFGAKAKMLTPEEALSLVGHPVGGVCPFAVHAGVTVYLDVSLRRFDTVFPACGSGNSAIELNLGELERYSNAAEWVDVCKGPA
jgi:prolyl-tRNA editing enzyme YbaK/EbsC (Cys-tRNA(Pro) deacylase)